MADAVLVLVIAISRRRFRADITSRVVADLAAKITCRPRVRLPHNAMNIQILLANVHRRLVGYMESGDADCLTNEDTSIEIQRLHEAADQLRTTEKQLWMQAQQLLGLIHYARYEALPAGQDQPELAQALAALLPLANDHNVVPESFTDILGTAADPDAQASLAAGLLEHALADLEPVVLGTAIDMFTLAVSNARPEHPRRGAMLSNLGLALRTRSCRTGSTEDLDRAFVLCEEAVGASAESPLQSSATRAPGWTASDQVRPNRFSRRSQQLDHLARSRSGRDPRWPPGSLPASVQPERRIPASSGSDGQTR